MKPTSSRKENFIVTPKFCAESGAHAVDTKCTRRVTADKRSILNIGQVERVPMQSEIGERGEVTPKRVRAVRDQIRDSGKVNLTYERDIHTQYN